VAKFLALETAIDEIASAMIATVMRMERIAIPAAVDVESVAARAYGTNTRVALLTAVEVLIEGYAKSTKEDLPVAREAAGTNCVVSIVVARSYVSNVEAGKNQQGTVLVTTQTAKNGAGQGQNVSVVVNV